MNQSKLYEWLLDNDCPWDFQLDESSYYLEYLQELPILFSDNEEDRVTAMKKETAEHFAKCPQSTEYSRNMFKEEA